MSKELERAITVHGLTKLARKVGVKPNALHNWRSRGIPANRAIALEGATGVHRSKWRPDLYPREAA